MNRKIAKELAKQFIMENRSLDWFEELYKQANFKTDIIPWADLAPNPNLIEWINTKPINFFKNKKILKIGCGLGDDSEYWSTHSNYVDAFDISPTAIEWCRKRFSLSNVRYFQADLTNIDSSYYEQYDIVQESYTLQVLPKEKREKAIDNLSKLVKKDGRLILICRGRQNEDPEGDMPFPLLKSELLILEKYFKVIKFEDYFDNEPQPVRRFRVEYLKQ